MDFDKDILGRLFEQAIESPRLRQSFDLRTSSSDSSQRILNALFPGTVVPIHRHPNTSETVVCLCGKMDEVNLIQIKKFHLSVRCNAFGFVLQKLGMEVKSLWGLGIRWK